MQLEILKGVHLRQMLLASAALLQENKQELNSLNVFPVPDGDTGTNMSLTISAAVTEVEGTNDDLCNVVDALANGSLMGARGNSGVILSQLFRGFASSLEGKLSVQPLEFARALQEGVKTAYLGVMKPVEGTILTVAKEGAKAAMKAARRGEDIIGLLKIAIREAEETLARTPEMLPVLKEAGVVDAGGKGLLYILQGALEGLPPDKLISPPAYVSPEIEGAEIKTALDKSPVLEYQYCTEFIIKGEDLNVDKMREQLSTMGDSIMAVGTTKVVKVHIHTNHPGQVLELGLRQGTLHDLKIDNMAEQHREILDMSAQNNLSSTPKTRADSAGKEEEEGLGVIAVALGEGMGNILRSLGVERVVSGGQTMNPSTEDLLYNIENSRYSSIILLPNNKNVILAAQQAQKLSNKHVYVVPTTTIPQGIAALLAFNPDASLEANGEDMSAVIGEIKTGEVTYAVRDSRFNGEEIKKGDIIGLAQGDIVAIGREPTEVVMGLMEHLVEETSEIVTIYYGEGATSTATEKLAVKIQNAYPHCDVEAYNGGQPLYYYILSVE